MYLEYVRKVIDGTILASEYTILACLRFNLFLKREDLEFRKDKVSKVINFISKLKHYTGRHSGKPFILQPWLLFIVANIFGFYYKDSGKRVIRNVYIECCRKLGKSALISAICLYCLLADDEDGSEVDCVANSRLLAKILFDMAATFCKGLDPKSKYLKSFRDKIKFNSRNSYMQVLSSDAATLDGFNAYCFCLDELHEAKDSKLYDVLKSSQGMRENPLAICITSAGFNMFGFCYEMRKTCIEVLRGIKTDDSLFSVIYCLDENDDYTDEKNWIKGNPNLDITVSRDFLKEQVKLAKNNSSLEVGIITKNFGKWCSSSDIWIDNDTLLKSSLKVDLGQFSNDIAYVGIDLSAVSDLTAVSVMIPKDNKFYFKTYYFLPQTCLSDNSNSEKYKEWKRHGLLYITSGNVVDYDYVLAELLKVNKIVPIDKVAYDSYNATQFAINATTEGLPLEPFSLALWNFNRCTKEFERLIKLGYVVVDDNEITRWCFSNVSLKFDHNDNVKPVKTLAQQKIDGVISMLEALGIYLNLPRYDNSIDY